MMAIQNVSEFPATAPEQIEHFAKLLSHSKLKREVFWEIYRGQSQQPKPSSEIGKKVHLSPKRVLELAKPLAVHQLFEQTKHGGRTAYKKYPNINAVKQQIMRLATDRQKLAKHVTVRRPKVSVSKIVVNVKNGSPNVFLDVRHITIDEIDSFSKVRSLKHSNVPSELDPPRLPEKVFKLGTANILGNRGTFTDWGGEKNDLYSNHLKIAGKRYFAAVGFKGPAKKGSLTPGKMGANGDQIQRLFDSDAQVFLVQYEGTIAQSVPEQLKKMAVDKSVSDRRTVFYGVIALEDSYRLRLKYKKQFKKAFKQAESD
jgi:hypothetical protein